MYSFLGLIPLLEYIAVRAAQISQAVNDSDEINMLNAFNSPLAVPG